MSDLRERLDIAERALLGHGYRKSCGIPACNCGDQWNHGGLARERLGEIDDATRAYYQNGETLLARIQRMVAEIEALRAKLADCQAFIRSRGHDADCPARHKYMAGGISFDVNVPPNAREVSPPCSDACGHDRTTGEKA